MEKLPNTEEVPSRSNGNGLNPQVCCNRRLSQGCTHLMYACQQGLSDEILLELRCKPKVILRRDNNNKNALHYCSAQKDLVAAASVALAAPELVESADEDGFTPLHLAVIQGNVALVNMLLAGKADVNALDNEGHSVVHWATVCGEVDALRTVLAAGADISTRDINGGCPLHYAAQMCGGNSDSSSGAKCGPVSSAVSMEILNIILLHPKSDVNVVDKDRRQPLLWAASAGSSKALVALIKAGAKVESADKDGLTAIHCAASRGHTECIDTLISLCGAPTDLIDTNGCTALHYAVTLGHADAVALLLDLDSDPNRQDRKGRTPAHCGCAKGQFETVKLLKDRGDANMWLRNAKGDLPIHEAAVSGRRELVQWLLEQRPKQVNVTSNDGRSLLHIAAGNANSEMCKMLLDQGADINSIYKTPRNVVMTPLDCSLLKGLRSTAKFLQLHGGLPASKLRLSGRTPNAINDQELVKPLHSTNKSNNEPKSNAISECQCSQHQHQCMCDAAEQRHRGRRHKQSKCCVHLRASSCETHARGNDSSDMYRSKSNIELHRTRKTHHQSKKMTARSQRNESSISTYSSTSSSESECMNCKAKRRDKPKKHRRNRAKSTPRRKSEKGNQSTDVKQLDRLHARRDRSSSDEEWSRKSVTKSYQIKEKTTKTTTKVVENKQSKQSEHIGNADQLDDTTEKLINSEGATNVMEVSENKTTAQDVPDIEIEPTKPLPTLSIDVSPPTPIPSDELAVSPKIIIATADVHASNVAEEALAHSDVENMKTVEGSQPKENNQVDGTDMDINGKQLSEVGEKVDGTQSQETVPSVNQIETTGQETGASEKHEKKQPVVESTVLPINEEALIKTLNENTTNQAAEDKLSKETKVVIKNDDNSNITAPPTPDTLSVPQPSQKRLPTPTSGSEEPNADEQAVTRKSSFTVLASDESIDHHMDELNSDFHNDSVSDGPSFKLLQPDEHINEAKTSDDDDEDHQLSLSADDGEEPLSNAGRLKRLKIRAQSSNVRRMVIDQTSRDQDSGFEPSPRALRTKIPSPQSLSGVVKSRRSVLGGRKPGDRGAVDMTTVTQNLKMNIRRYYMERKIFQHLLELKSLQIRSSKQNEAVLVKRAVEDYHKSTLALGAGCVAKSADSDEGFGVGSPVYIPLRRYSYKEYTFKNFEIFLYESLKGLQKSGTHSFQNISDVYREAERRLSSPDFGRSDKALQCTTKTHRCLHAAHAYTGIPCAAYIPLMNHHTMPKYGFGTLKGAGLGSFYLPKIARTSTKTASKHKSSISATATPLGRTASAAIAENNNNRVSLELSHGNNRQLIALPANKLDNNKRYYVTFTVKGNDAHQQPSHKSE